MCGFYSATLYKSKGDSRISGVRNCNFVLLHYIKYLGTREGSAQDLAAFAGETYTPNPIESVTIASALQTLFQFCAMSKNVPTPIYAVDVM